MGTVITPEISEKNEYWISRHRYYELKHFCLQYKEWVKSYLGLKETLVTSSKGNQSGVKGTDTSDPTGELAVKMRNLRDKIQTVESCAYQADSELHEYLLRGVTEARTFENLKARLDIPCSRNTYYDRYRKFFWLLSAARN